MSSLEIPMYVNYVLLCSAGFVFSWYNENFITMVLFTVGLLLLNIFFAFRKIRSRFLFLCFNLSLFLFLLGRPFFRLFDPGIEQEWYTYGNNASREAITLIFMSLVCLLIGFLIIDCWQSDSGKSFQQYKIKCKRQQGRRIQAISWYMFCFTASFRCIIELERFQFMAGKAYEEVYVSFTSSLPAIIHAMAGLNVYFLCIFLAMLPEKRKARFALMVYFLLSLPMLFIGARGITVSALAFVVAYYYFRYIVTAEELWIETKEIKIGCLLIPLGIFFLGTYNYLREGNISVNLFSLAIFPDFIIKQGVSFNTLCLGLENIDYLRSLGDKYYFFGPLVDFIKHGVLSQFIFDNPSLPAGNSMEMVWYGNSMAHDLSFLTHGGYLSGHGFGSSYILEIYYDFGYFGVIIWNLFLGMFFASMIKLFTINFIINTIILIMLTSIFMMPRSGALEFMTFILKPNFWLVIILCLFYSRILLKKLRRDYALR